MFYIRTFYFILFVADAVEGKHVIRLHSWWQNHSDTNATNNGGCSRQKRLRIIIFDTSPYFFLSPSLPSGISKMKLILPRECVMASDHLFKCSQIELVDSIFECIRIVIRVPWTFFSFFQPVEILDFEGRRHMCIATKATAKKSSSSSTQPGASSLINIK